MRHRDIHILTTGTYTYTSDQRFQALHKPDVEPEPGTDRKLWSEWTLCVKWVQERDSGIYECQLSTAPVTSHAFHLNVVGQLIIPQLYSNVIFHLLVVAFLKLATLPHGFGATGQFDENSYLLSTMFVVPKARILSEGPDLYVDAGSTLNLTCVIGASPEPPDYIFWFYNQKVSGMAIVFLL